MGLLTVGVGLSVTLWPAFGTLFYLLVCLVQPPYKGVFSSYYFILFVVFDCSLLDASSFLKRKEGKWI